MEWLLLAGLGGYLAYYLGHKKAAPAPAPAPGPSLPPNPSSAVFGMADDGIVSFTADAQTKLMAMMQLQGWVALVTPESQAASQALLGSPAMIMAMGADPSQAPPALPTLAASEPTFDVFLSTTALTMTPSVAAFVQRGHIPTPGITGAPPVARTVADAAAGQPRLVRLLRQGDVMVLS